MASAVRIGQRQRAGRGQVPCKIGGSRRAVLAGESGDWLLARLTGLGVALMAGRELSLGPDGQVQLVSVLGGAPLDCAVDHLVMVADRVPADGLAQQLLSDPASLAEAGIKSVDPVGDCVAPGLIAHAIYAAHRLARSF